MALPPSINRLDVVQLPAAVSDESLRHVFHKKDTAVPTEILEADRQRLEQQIAVALKRALSGSDSKILATADVDTMEAAPDIAIGRPLDAAALEALHLNSPADIYLLIQATDYGLTPESWKSGYITFEVATTLAIGAVLYVHKATRPLAFVYVGQEGIEEAVEGYSGFWLLNRLSRPVRVDAELVDGVSGKVLWRDSFTGMADWTWGHVWNMDDAIRDQLLQDSVARAAKELVAGVEGK